MNSKFSDNLLLFRDCLELHQMNLFDFSITRIFSCYFIKEIISCCSPQKSEQQGALGFVPNIKYYVDEVK
jgi:hypothetical protein